MSGAGSVGRQEQEPRREREGRSGSGDGEQKKMISSFVDLLELLKLRWIERKVRAMGEGGVGESGGEINLEVVEEIKRILESEEEDEKEKEKAKNQLETIWRVLQEEERLGEMTRWEDILSKENEELRKRIKTVRSRLEEGLEVTDKEVEELYELVKEKGKEMGLLEEEEAEDVDVGKLVNEWRKERERLQREVGVLRARRQLNQFIEGKDNEVVEVTAKAVEAIADFGGEEEEEKKDILEVRSRLVRNREEEEERLNGFKKMVREDLKKVEGQRQAVLLSEEELEERLAKVKILLQREGIYAGGNVDELMKVRGVLLRVAAMYEEVLILRMAEKLNRVRPVNEERQYLFIRAKVSEWVLDKLSRRGEGEGWASFTKEMEDFWNEYGDEVGVFGEEFEAVKIGRWGSRQARRIERILNELSPQMIAELFEIAQGGDRAAFEELLRLIGMSGGVAATNEEVEQLWKSMSSLEVRRGRERGLGVRGIRDEIRSGVIGEMRELRDRGEYDKYLLQLIAYLSRVGLREGLNDWELAVIMRDASYWLSDELKVPDEYVKLYDAWVLTEIYGAQYGGLRNMEDYHSLMLKYGEKGIEALELFVHDRGAREALGIEVSWQEGDVERKQRVAVWRFYDMLNNASWLRRLARVKIGSENRVYDEMMLSLLLTQGREVVEIRERDGRKFVKWGDEEKALDEIKLKIGGKEVKALEFLMNYRWMVRTAEHFSNLTLRTAHLYRVDFKTGKEKRINKNVHAVTQISTYAHTYGIGTAFFRKLMNLDGLMYSVANYKGLVELGLRNMFEKVGIEGEELDRLVKILSKLLRQKRFIDGEEFATHYIGVEDLPFVVREGEVSYEEAREELVRRRKMEGVGLARRGGEIVFEWDELTPEEQEQYRWSIEMFQKRLNLLRMSADARQEIESIVGDRWQEINTALREMGVEIDVDGGLNEFIRSFSYATFTEYGALKSSDLENFGKYNALMEKAIGVFKSGFGHGTVVAFLELVNTMSGYLSIYAPDFARWAGLILEAFREFRTLQARVVFPETSKQRDSHGRETKHYNLEGETKLTRDPAGEIVQDQQGLVATKKVVEYWVNLGRRYYNMMPLRRIEFEQMIDFLVNKGVITKDFGESFLKEHFGPRWWRWVWRTIMFDDPGAALAYIVESGFKMGGEVIKYILSG